MQVGDKVKVISRKSTFDNVTGTIREVSDNVMFKYLVEFDRITKVIGIPYKKMVFSEDELELI